MVNITFNNYGHADRDKGATTRKWTVVGLPRPQAVGDRDMIWRMVGHTSDYRPKGLTDY